MSYARNSRCVCYHLAALLREMPRGPAFIRADIAVSSLAEVSAMAISAGKREMDNLQRLLAMAKAEDLGNGDITGELLPADLSAEARFAAHNAYRDVARGLIK